MITSHTAQAKHTFYYAEKYKEVNNNIKRCMKKAKEKWIGQCSEVEENLREKTTVRGHTNL